MHAKTQGTYATGSAQPASAAHEAKPSREDQGDYFLVLSVLCFLVALMYTAFLAISRFWSAERTGYSVGRTAELLPATRIDS